MPEGLQTQVQPLLWGLCMPCPLEMGPAVGCGRGLPWGRAGRSIPGKGPLPEGGQDGGLGSVGQHPKGLSTFQNPSQVDLQPQETFPITEAREAGWGDTQYRQKITGLWFQDKLRQR